MITIAFITIFVYYKLAFQYFLLSFSIAKDNAGQKKSRITLIFLDIKVWSEFRQIQTKTKGTFANRKYICRRLRANIFIFQFTVNSSTTEENCFMVISRREKCRFSQSSSSCSLQKYPRAWITKVRI